MRGSGGGPRLMLRRLRGLMADEISPQERLDQITTIVAANLVAEVCSIYVLTGDGLLELYATEGLKREAVHKTTLRLGEGLVGLIGQEAKPLRLADAQHHPSFAYKPETGEEIYNSFLGVPVLRGGQTLGVVVIQNRTRRVYEDEELEALETVSMLLAEIIASDELEGTAQTSSMLALQRPFQAKGFILSEGLGLGHAVLHEPRVVISLLIAEDPEVELERLEEGLGKLRASLDSLIEADELQLVGEHREVLESYRMFAHDQGWARRIREAIRSGLTAEAAVERVQNDTRARMLRQTDPYLRERLHDLDDLANRLLRELVGWTGPTLELEDGRDIILIARSMGPAELLDYDRSRLRGLVLEEGTPSSHVTIVARALGIPAVGQVPGILDMVRPGNPLIVDGLSGDVHLRPTSDVEKAYADKVRLRATRQARYAELRDTPAITKDGVPISLLLNAGLLIDLPSIQEAGADGIGLFRTELQFMVSAKLPKTGEQSKLYAQILDALGDHPVTFRTLDVGGDKVLPYLRLHQEDNPAMGLRAIRLALDRPGLLKTQTRALIRAAAGADLRIMFPMITDMSEFRSARKIIEDERERAIARGREPPRSIRTGAMIEVPNLLFQLDTLVTEADFVSVGSNDLLQFMFALDRTNTRVADRFDTMSASVLRALKSITDAGDRHGKSVTLCGELAGRPLEAMALLGLGYRAVSMAPSAIGPVKSMLLALDVGALSREMDEWLDDGATDIRARLAAFAKRHDIPL
ncbi:MAG: phosphoenolpyruvate--protein phosphotransferase [Pseudomonadota bacterium]